MSLHLLETPAPVAYAHLRELIMDARLLPNSHYVDDALSEQLTYETNDIRAATRQLEEDGLVCRTVDGGFWIKPLPVDTVLQVYSRVGLLESRAAFVAAEDGADPLALLALDDAVRVMEDATYRHDPTCWARAAHHFHRSLVQASRHTSLISTALAMSEQVHRARMLTLSFDSVPADAAQSQAAVVEAIRRGDGAQARDTLLDNWRNATIRAALVLKNNGLDQPLQNEGL